MVQVISNLKRLCDRQDVEEMRALYGGGSYILAKPYQHFKVDTQTWHGWSEAKRRSYLHSFRQYIPNVSDDFKKPKISGRKPMDTSFS